MMRKRTKQDKVSLYEFFKMFPDEGLARKCFEEQKWGKDGKDRYCSHCGSFNTIEIKHPTMPYRCRDCRKYFSVRTNTVLAKSKISLHKWLMAIYLLNTNLKGISSLKLSSDVEVTQKTAWFLGHRIRESFDEQSDNPLLSPVEVDETYVGGLERNKHQSNRTKGTQGRSTKTKSAVVGIKSRIDKKVKAKVTEVVDSKTLEGLIDKTVDAESTIYTDENRGYSGLNKKGYKHKTVNHGVGEYIREQAHTNGMESFWSMLKRGYTGIYHFMSRKHLQRYVDEYAGRHNNRPLPTMDQIKKVIKRLEGKRLEGKRLEGKRLKYKELIG